MLDHFYRRPTTVDRMRARFLGSALDRYAAWLHGRQTSQARALYKLQTAVQFERFVVARGVREVAELPAHVDAFIEAWSRARRRPPDAQTPRRAIEELLSLIVPGFATAPRSRPWPLLRIAPGFLEHLREERGLRPATLVDYAHHLRAFEDFLTSAVVTTAAALTPALLNHFVQTSTAGLHPLTRQGRAGVLRVLLRFLHRQGLAPRDLSRSIPWGRTYRCAGLPRAIPWPQVERVLATIDRRSVSGRRDYAMLMLMATYGLRAQEVAALTLDAIDWPRQQFHVTGRKAGNSTTYPLSAAVGTALLDYLQNGRPASADRRVFLRLQAPFTGFVGCFAVSGRATLALQRAGIAVPRAGSHTFRHSCVQRLVEAEVPFRQIGEYLGHRSEEATQVYAKVAVHRLRALALGAAEDVL